MSSQPSSREETELYARVQRWIGDDPDRAASAELEALVAARIACTTDACDPVDGCRYTPNEGIAASSAVLR
jgi:hypothetical protein